MANKIVEGCSDTQTALKGGDSFRPFAKRGKYSLFINQGNEGCFTKVTWVTSEGFEYPCFWGSREDAERRFRLLDPKKDPDETGCTKRYRRREG